MSAEVILMNKNGIAIAADSAVTIGNKTKIYNTADKMFTLSKHAPVGILIYNSSAFMGIQIDLIVKEYRKKLGEKKFDTLIEYVEDFKTFCIEFINEYTGEYMEIEIINMQILHICNTIFTILADLGMKEISGKKIVRDDELIEFYNTKLDEILNHVDTTITENFISDEYYSKILPQLDVDHIIEIVENGIEIEIKDENKIKLKTKLLEAIRNIKLWDLTRYSGIAITGYGEKEIYPSCVKFETIGMIDKKIIYLKNQVYEITYQNTAEIVALAQTDVMNEFFLGVNNEIENEYTRIYLNKTKSYADDSKCVIIEEIKDEMNKKRDEIVAKRSNNIYRSLAFLPREEMIYMAEGMINLTSFKRRLVLDNYSQTVGGPIDLAYISKGDGFIWIKRKQYFSKDLNYVFMENYFKGKGDVNEQSNSEGTV